MATFPTAWLAPPENLLSSAYSTTIVPAPIAISATIALVVGTAVLVLFNRKDKEVFLEDQIQKATAITTPNFATDNAVGSNYQPPISETLPIQRPPLVYAKTLRKETSFEHQPKLDAVLGLKDNWDFEHIVQTPRSPVGHPSYFAPSRISDVSEVDTLKDDDKNSAYVPYPRSETSDNTHRYAQHMLGRAEDRRAPDGESVFRRSPLSLASRTDLGDAY